jgi:hypothetical protein
MFNEDNLLYVYGMVPTNEKENFPTFDHLGFDNKHPIIFKEIGKITAIVCNLDQDEFTKERIDELVQDPKWVEEKATHHHLVLSELHKNCTVIPLKFCTIYSSSQNLFEELNKKHDEIIDLLIKFKQRDGWNLKVYCDIEKIQTYVNEKDPAIIEMKEDIKKMKPGKQFLMKKKLEKKKSEKVKMEIERLSTMLDEQLKQYSFEYKEKKLWNKQITGRSEEMVSNRVYLVSNGEPLKNFKKQASKFLSDYKEYGFLLEITGPWPPYDFLDNKTRD